MISEPLVSIYIPTKNRADFLDRALASLCTQTYKNIEVLVCDDGSDVDIQHIQKKYEVKFSRFNWIRNEESIGAPASRNRMIEAAEGEYITGLDDDDEFLPDRVERFVRHAGRDKYSFLASPIWTNNGRFLFKSMNKRGIISLERLLRGNIIGNQIFTKTSWLREIGGFDITFPSWQDYDTWLRLVDRFGPGYKIATPTYIFNIAHELGRISTSDRAHQGYLKFIEKHADKIRSKHLNMLYFRDLINRDARVVDYSQFFSNISFESMHLCLKYIIKRSINVSNALFKGVGK